jgi:DNA-binding MarR family transcriptional regulator
MATAQTQVKDSPPLVESSALLLARLGRVASRQLTEELVGTGLKPPHAAILIMLRDLGPMSQQAIGERLHVDPSNLVAFLNALEADELLVRKRDPSDRRRHIVEITPKGVERMPACAEPVGSLDEQLLAGLSGEEREQLHRMLAQILENMALEESTEDFD